MAAAGVTAMEPMTVPLPAELKIAQPIANAPGLDDKRGELLVATANGQKKAEGEAAKPGPKAKGKARPKGKAAAGGGGGGKGKGKGKSRQTHFRLNVRNLNVAINTDRLIELFQPFGKVVQAQVRTHEDGTSRTIGYVTYSTEDEALRAVEAMDGKKVQGRPLKVEPAEEKKAGDDPTVVVSADLQQRQAAYMNYVYNVQQRAMGQYMAMTQHAMMQQAAMASAYQQATIQAALEMEDPYSYDEMGGYEMDGYGGEAIDEYGMMQDMGGYGQADHDQTVYVGKLWHMHKKSGYGFIKCDETRALYGRDVYVTGKVLPEGITIGDALQFNVEVNDQGQPKVSWCSAL